MKILPGCVPCISKQIMKIAQLVYDDTNLQMNLMRFGVNFLSSIDWNKSALEIISLLYKELHEKFEIYDPYKDIKVKSNEMMLSLINSLRGYLERADDPLRVTLKLSVAGNIIDYGTERTFDAIKTIERVLNTDFYIDDYKILREKLSSSKKILMIGDNAGEIVLDKILVELLRRMGLEVYYMVRAHPVINDATMEDAIQIGMDKLAKIVELDISGVGRGIRYTEIEDYMKSFDIILSKGQGNFELFSDLKDENIIFLLMVKCDVISYYINAPIGSSILMSIERIRCR